MVAVEVVSSRGLNSVDTCLDQFTMSRRTLKEAAASGIKMKKILCRTFLVKLGKHLRTQQKKGPRLASFPHIQLSHVQQVQLQRGANEKWIGVSYSSLVFSFLSLIPSFSLTAAGSRVAVTFSFIYFF